MSRAPLPARAGLLAAAVAIGGLLLAFLPGISALPWLMSAVTLTPLVVVLVARWPIARLAAGIGGLLLLAAGLTALLRDGALVERLALWQVRATDPYTLVAPAALALTGLCWTAASLALQGERRRLLVAAGWLGSAAALGGVVAVAALPLYSMLQTGLLVSSPRPFTAAVLLLAVAVLVPLLGVRSARAMPRRPVRPRAVLATTGAVVVVLGVTAVLVTRPYVEREPLAELVPDAALAECVAAAVGVAGPEAGVTRHELTEIRSLECPLAGVADLAGLDLLVDLASLELRENEVSNLEPLASLDKLGRLGLSHNDVADLTPLAELPVLTDLGLSGNRIRDLGPLAGAGNLVHLGLANNELTDLAPLAGLDLLADLNLSDNGVSDAAPLAALDRLGRLTLAGNRITDPSPLGALPALTVLDVSRNEVSDATLFTGFPELTELWVGENPLTDLAPLAGLPSLTGVDVRGLADAAGKDTLEARGVYVGGGAK